MNRAANWDILSTLITGIGGVKNAEHGKDIPVMIHAATTGSFNESIKFYNSIISRSVDFNVIGLSYYPWRHGTLEQMEENLTALSSEFTQDIMLVETAYYANGFWRKDQWTMQFFS